MRFFSGNPLDCRKGFNWVAEDGSDILSDADQTLCHLPSHQNKAKPILKVLHLIKVATKIIQKSVRISMYITNFHIYRKWEENVTQTVVAKWSTLGSKIMKSFLKLVWIAPIWDGQNSHHQTNCLGRRILWFCPIIR